MVKEVCATVAIACLFGCGGSSSTGTPIINNTPPPVGGVAVTNNAFSPKDKAGVPVGTAVTWAWDTCSADYNGQTCVLHSVTFDDGSTSSALQSTGTFTRTFATPGVYTYHCSIHVAQGMTGSITVQ